ncbi:MAG: GAF domain-containing protein, partial [Anaerolineae bacterium]|nr:GAF domain-containing protein [Anaerolineae bacterium]
MIANLLAFHLFVTSILFLLVGGYSLHRRQVNTAAIPFSVAMFSLGIFTLLAGWDVLSTTLEIKIILMRLRLSILPFTTIAALVAALENTQRSAWLSRQRIGLLSFIPALNLAFVWLPGLEKYLRSGYKLDGVEFLSTLTYSNGVWFWVLWGYSSLIALIIFGVQFNVLLNSKGIYFKQTLFLSVGQTIPAVLIILLAAGTLELQEGYNYAPHALMLTALLNGWAIYRYQWKFTAPMARDIALDLVSDMMLVVNESDRISDANTSAQKFFEISDADIGINISDFIPEWNKIRIDVQGQEILRREIDLSKDNKIKIYELTVNPARNPGSQIVSAYVLLLREITEQKRQQEQVQNLVRAVSQSPNSVLITSRDGIIEYVNPSFTRLTGYSAEEAIGQKPSLFKSGQTPDSVYKDMWKTINSGQMWKGDLLNRRKDGEVYWEETLIAPLFDQYGQVVNYISIKEDISTRKEVDEILHRRLEELLMVNTISMAAASQLDLNSLVSLIGQQLEQSFNARSVLIALHNHDSEFIEIPYWTIDKKRVTPPQIKYGEGLVSHILKTRQPLLISNNFRETALQMGHKPVFANEYGYPKTWLGVPIISGQQTVGVISLQNYTKEFAFNDDDVRLLNTISASISISIDNARLYRAAQQEIEERIRAEQDASRRTSQLSVLYEIGHSLTKELELEVVLNSLMENCKQLAPVDVFVVGLYDSENDQVKFIKFNDNGKERPHIHLEKDLDQYITGEVIKKQITIHLPDCSDKTTHKQHRLRHTTKQHALSYLGIPLFRGNEVTGILSVQSYQPNAFSPEQIQTLEIIASQAAIAIDNARLYEV